MAIDRINATALLDGGVTTADIADDAVTSAKLDTNIAITGDLTVDTNTLHVDAANNRVGVGLTAPEQPFHVRSSTFAYMRSESTNATYTGLDVGQHQSGYGVINMRDNQDIRFYTNDAEKIRIQAAGGISFNGDTAAANALDDYEEGTWTPGFDNTIGNGPTVTYTNQIGSYTKVGNRVHWTARISWSAFSVNGSGYALLVGFPFTANSSGFSQGANVFGYANGIGGSYGLSGLYIDPNSNKFYMTNGANPTAELSVNNISSSGTFFCGGCVQV